MSEESLCQSSGGLGGPCFASSPPQQSLRPTTHWCYPRRCKHVPHVSRPDTSAGWSPICFVPKAPCLERGFMGAAIIDQLKTHPDLGAVEAIPRGVFAPKERALPIRMIMAFKKRERPRRAGSQAGAATPTSGSTPPNPPLPCSSGTTSCTCKDFRRVLHVARRRAPARAAQPLHVRAQELAFASHGVETVLRRRIRPPRRRADPQWDFRPGGEPTPAVHEGASRHAAARISGGPSADLRLHGIQRDRWSLARLYVRLRR